MSHLTHLECSATGERTAADRLHMLSPAGRPWLCRYDLDAIRSNVDRDALARRPRGMWRWRELMPPAQPITLGEGDTPLLDAPRLASTLGVRRLLIKDESLEPRSEEH